MLEILRYTLPALVVALTAWLVLRMALKHERQERAFALRRDTLKEGLPIRLRAYERLALLLERTTPEQLLEGLSLQELNAQELCTLLLEKVHMEYNHNLSQQVYISNAAWQSIEEAKQQTLLFIGTTSRQFPAGTSALEVAKYMVEAYHANGETPNERALARLKEEARALFA